MHHHVRALSVQVVCSQMGDLYASAIGTTVLQLREIPPRPAEYDGALCLFDLGKDTNETTIRVALSKFGEIVSIEIGEWPPAIVRFNKHGAALAVKQKAAAATASCTTAEEIATAVAIALGLQCGIPDTLYNERSYDGRMGEAGWDDDDGRGW